MKKSRKKSRKFAENALLMAIILLTIYQIVLFFKPAVEFGEWAYSTKKTNDWYLEEKTGDVNWQTIELPFDRYYEGDRLLFRGTLFVPEGGDAKFIFFVDDCVDYIYVNDRLAFQYSDCGSCTHCSGVEVDLSKFVKPGENSLAVEVININKTGAIFNVKRLGTAPGLWVCISLIMGVVVAMKLES